MQQSGLVDHAQIMATYVNRNPCSIFGSKGYQKPNKKQDQPAATPLRFRDLIGIFYAFGTGLALAFAAFISELVRHNLHKTK